MNMRKHIINLLFAVVAFMTGCSESLEDTYSDFAGDGKNPLRGEMFRSGHYCGVGNV